MPRRKGRRAGRGEGSEPRPRKGGSRSAANALFTIAEEDEGQRWRNGTGRKARGMTGNGDSYATERKHRYLGQGSRDHWKGGSVQVFYDIHLFVCTFCSDRYKRPLPVQSFVGSAGSRIEANCNPQAGVARLKGNDREPQNGVARSRDVTRCLFMCRVLPSD